MKRFITLLILGSILSLNYISAQTDVWGQLGSDINGVAQEDHLGNSVSMNSDGSVIAIGAPDNDGNGSTSGSVDIFKFNGTDWQQLGNTIYGDSGDQSGFSISLNDDGTIVAIGAIFNGGWNFPGGVRIYMYDQNSNSWSQLGSTINGNNNEYFGHSVSLSSDGSVVAIGSTDNSTNAYDAGVVRVYSYSSANWTQVGGDIYGTSYKEYFGYSVSLSNDGTILAAGGPNYSDSKTEAGVVRIYKYDNTSWNQLGTDIVGKADYYYTGSSLELNADGSTIVISASADNNTTRKGEVYVYKYDGTNWNKAGNDIVGSTSSNPIHKTVSINSDGSVIAVGNPNEDPNNDDSNNGVVRVYKFNTSSSTWEQVAGDIIGESASDGFGDAVCINDAGNIVVAGAPFNDAGNSSNTYNCGSARIFELTTATKVSSLMSDNISIYPNPTRGVLNIRSKENIKQVIISNITGETILTNSNENQTHSINLSHIKNGIYIITIKTDSGIVTRKLIKK